MLHVMLILLLCFSANTVVKAEECDPNRFMCSWSCPPLPKGLEAPTDQAICSKDSKDTCVCWLHNPSSQLRTLFQCDAKINGSVSKTTCVPPVSCFSPDHRVGCLVVLRCPCLPFDQQYQSSKKREDWFRVRAVVHTMKIQESNRQGGQVKEKIQGDIREFSLKHLLFLLGFVIAPLLCWCLLNFFHEGKCRKKRPPQQPETLPIPTSRSTTVDNMNNTDETEQPEVTVVPSPSHLPSVPSRTFSIQLPTAPEDLDAMLNTDEQQTQLKCESPPPYCESLERNFQIDLGPPPSYDEVVNSTDINAQQLWQTIFIMQPAQRENA